MATSRTSLVRPLTLECMHTFLYWPPLIPETGDAWQQFINGLTRSVSYIVYQNNTPIAFADGTSFLEDNVNLIDANSNGSVIVANLVRVLLWSSFLRFCRRTAVFCIYSRLVLPTKLSCEQLPHVPLVCPWF